MSVDVSVDTVRMFEGESAFEADAMFDSFFETLPGVCGDVDCDGTMKLSWTDSLQFHSEYMSDRWAEMVDEDGYLTDEVAEAAVQSIEDALQSKHIELTHDPAEEWDDEPSIGITVYVDLPAGLDTTLEVAYDMAWEVIATLANMTDPGTFGSPYMYTEALRKLGK